MRLRIAGTVAVLLLDTLVDATPRIAYPINAQVPPVARIAESFSFSFSSSTFASDYPISYSLENTDATWLSLDGSTRTLSGTPPNEDANTAPYIGIVATDATGSVYMNTTLVISSDPAPVVNVPLSSQLASFGAHSAPSSILFYPSTPFNFSFDIDTFTVVGPTTGLNYYAVTLENTPLPSWITFNGSELSFRGETPDYFSLVQPPQTFGFQLIASRVLGFSGVSIPFNIVVGNHVLAFKDTTIMANATVGTGFEFNGLSGGLTLNGDVINGTQLSSVTADTPSWLLFDNTTFVLSGTPSSEAVLTNVTITAVDPFGDIANTTIYINITGHLFTSTLTALNATIGVYFSKDLSTSILNVKDVDVTAQFSPITDWLSFNSQTLILSGQVPSHAQPSIIKVTLNATSRTSRLSDVQSFELKIVSAMTNSATSSSSGTQSSRRPSSTTVTNNSKESSSNRISKGAIVAAVAVPIVVLLVSLLLCVCCMRRRRKDLMRATSPAKSDISGPITHYLSVAEVGASDRAFLRQRIEANRTRFSNSPNYVIEKHRNSRWYITGTMRRSETTSGLSGTESSNYRESRSSGIRGRSFSENALSRADNSWRSTQDSSYPTIGSKSLSSGQITRNFSRKTGTANIQRSSSSMPLSDSNISQAQISRLSGLSFITGEPSKQSSIQQTPEFAYGLETQIRGNKRRRAPSYLSGAADLDGQQSGVGHGARKAGSRFSFLEKRRTHGHGMAENLPSFGPRGHSIVRNSASNFPVQAAFAGSSSWVTTQAGDRQSRFRQSQYSAMTESTDVLYPEDAMRKSLKLVPPSPQPPRSAHLSTSTISTRPVSRRTTGSSPFFGGSSRSNSRRSPASKFQYSQTESPAVPTVAETNDALSDQIERSLPPRSLEEQIASQLRVSCVDEIERDGLGISYGSPQEGTRRLQSMVDTVHDSVNRFRNSLNSLSDSSSRFNDAPSSYASASRHFYKEDEDYEDDYEGDYVKRRRLGHSPSRSSYESRQFGRDSHGNMIEYDDDDSPQIAQAEARPSLSTASPNAIPVRGMRWDRGPERRPISVDLLMKRDNSVAASRTDGDQENELQLGQGSAFL
jgi:axial budding pattern protein 2